MKKPILLGVLLLVISLTLGLISGVVLQSPKNDSQERIYAVIQGKFVGNSPQLEDGYYTVFLWGVPDRFDTIYFQENHIDTYDHTLFGEVNTFYLAFHAGVDKWVVTSVTNSNGTVGYWEVEFQQ